MVNYQLIFFSGIERMSRKIRSPVWDYFRRSDGGQNRNIANCNICMKTVFCSGNTTNLISHLRLNHVAVYAEVHPKLSKRAKPKTKPTIVPGLLDEDTNTRESEVSTVFELEAGMVDTTQHSNTFRNVVRTESNSTSSTDTGSSTGNDVETEFYPVGGLRMKAILRALTILIVKGMHPISIVDEPHFQHFVSVLDSFRLRFKKKYFTTGGHSTEQRILSELSASNREALAALHTINQPTQDPANESGLVEQSIWDYHDSSISATNAAIETGPSRNAAANALVLVADYKDLPFIERSKDPLNWWLSKKRDGLLVPFIKPVKKFLCVTATSVPSEQLFSKAGELVSQKRNRISATNVDLILFLNKNA